MSMPTAAIIDDSAILRSELRQTSSSIEVEVVAGLAHYLLEPFEVAHTTPVLLQALQRPETAAARRQL